MLLSTIAAVGEVLKFCLSWLLVVGVIGVDDDDGGVIGGGGCGIDALR